MRVVLDTNQYVSALLKPDGLQARLLRLWQEESFELLSSEVILAELANVLNRPYFKKHGSVTGEDVQKLLNLLRNHATLTSGHVDVDAVPDDPADNKILACAVEGAADWVISGDRHLLAIRSYQGIPITSASEFHERMAKT